MRETARCSSRRPARWADYSGNLSLLITTIDLQQAQSAVHRVQHNRQFLKYLTMPTAATGWTVRGSNPGGGKRLSLLSTSPDRHWGPTQVTVAGRWRSPPTPSSTEVKKKWSFSSTPPLCLHGRSLRSAQRSSFINVFVLIFFDFRRFLTK
jgi:hypothetical protein